jgi:dephospho-CoA kinase
MAPRLLIGLTGNIATGKSSVAKTLRDLGAFVIDADEISHLVVRKGQPALAEIARAFGADILLPVGELDRKALGRVVFNDAEKLKRLESIVHPAVHEEIARQIDALPAGRIAVIEVIKLFESGWAEKCDQVWVTHCAPEEQVLRLMHSRGLSETEARARVQAQNPQTAKLTQADVVIDTSGTYAQTRRLVQQAWEKVTGILAA